jgi:hypothetical protein
MTPGELTVTLSINQPTLGGTEPAGTTIALRASAAGLFETGGVGGGGQATEPLPLERIVQVLDEHFDRAALRAVLDNLTRLRDAL